MARSDRSMLASENHGKPAVAATARPGVFKGEGVVAAHSANMNDSRPGGNPNMHMDRPPSARNNNSNVNGERPQSQNNHTNTNQTNQNRQNSEQTNNHPNNNSKPPKQSHQESRPPEHEQHQGGHEGSGHGR
jgi:hypothetical protein